MDQPFIPADPGDKELEAGKLTGNLGIIDQARGAALLPRLLFQYAIAQSHQIRFSSGLYD